MTLTTGTTTRTTAIPTTASLAVVGIDAGARTEREAEHLLLHLVDEIAARGTAVEWALTHRVLRDGSPRLAISLAADASDERLLADLAVIDPELVRCAGATQAHTDRSEGRAVRFPGSTALVGSVPLMDVVARSAIDRVQLLGGGDVDTHTVLHTRDFVRPRFVGGELVLHVQRARRDSVVPFETPNPTPCCADH